MLHAAAISLLISLACGQSLLISPASLSISLASLEGKSCLCARVSLGMASIDLKVEVEDGRHIYKSHSQPDPLDSSSSSHLPSP